ncbi:hypothetical protein GCM10007094_23230 [Pseudovibrio japonicus]|uniref:Uncharacterized protein n=1 Tax=Pseudovibrio japonicus TaxID=366534 RepID=A0ABQ3EIT8_9HYPH|nr:hypothetical protein [Pseudovibrio japonicus]GHB33741.1 hypothetical protein GCM10007094_23230 [Pseudovibrio japonicus]
MTEFDKLFTEEEVLREDHEQMEQERAEKAAEAEELLPGMVCYIPDGTQGEYLGKVPAGHLVRLEFETWDEFADPTSSFGKLEIVPHVMSTKPKIYRADEFMELDDAIAAKRNELEELEEKLYEAKLAQQKTLQELEKVNGLETLSAFVNGDFHYMVLDGYLPSLVDLSSKELKCSDGIWRMIALMAERHKRENFHERKVSFQVMQYSDGSGGPGTPCHFYRTKEEAEVKLQKLWSRYLNDELNSLRDHKKCNSHTILRAIEAGLKVPSDLVEAACEGVEREAALCESNFNRSKKEYAKACEALKRNKEIIRGGSA